MPPHEGRRATAAFTRGIQQAFDSTRDLQIFCNHLATKATGEFDPAYEATELLNIFTPRQSPSSYLLDSLKSRLSKAGASDARIALVQSEFSAALKNRWLTYLCRELKSVHDHTRAVEWIQNHCPSEGEPTLGGLCRDEWGSQPTFAQTSHASRRLPQPAPLYQGFDRDSQHSTRQCEQAPLSSITWHDDQQANQEADVVDYLSENPEDDWTYPQYQARQSSVPMSDQGYPSRQRDATRSKSPDRISVASSSRKRNHVGQLSEQQQAPPLQRPRLDTRYAYAIARVPGPVIPAQRDYDLGLSRIVEAEREDDEHDRSSAEQDLLDFSDPEPQPEPETALTTPDSEGGKEMGMNWHLQQKLQHAKFPVVDVLVNTSCHWRWEDRRQIIQAMHKGLCARLQGREYASNFELTWTAVSAQTLRSYSWPPKVLRNIRSHMGGCFSLRPFDSELVQKNMSQKLEPFVLANLDKFPELEHCRFVDRFFKLQGGQLPEAKATPVAFKEGLDIPMIDKSVRSGIELRSSLDKLCDEPADASHAAIKVIAEHIAASLIPAQTFDIITTRFKNAVVREVNDSEIWEANREQVETCLSSALRHRFVELSSQELVKHGFVGGILRSFGELIERQMREPGVELQQLIREILETKAEGEAGSMLETTETSLKKEDKAKTSGPIGTTAAPDAKRVDSVQDDTGKAKNKFQLMSGQAKVPKQKRDSARHETEKARKKRKRPSSKAPSSRIVPGLDSPPADGQGQMSMVQATGGDARAFLKPEELGQADKDAKGGGKRNGGRPSWGAEKSEKRMRSHHKHYSKGEKLY